MKTRLLLALILSGLITSQASQTPAALVNGLLEADAGTRVVERGQDFAVFERVTITTNADGSTSSVSNRFTLLENCLHYQDSGAWKLSEDLIEPFPTGAIARRGPNKAIFSSDLNAETVFDIQTAAGERVRGGVRSIQLTDIASGRTVVLGTVKAVAAGVVVAPNQVVYKSAFDGIDADVLFVWRHNSISQNVILNQKPILPPGMDPASARIEVVTELVESPPPVLNTVVPRKPPDPDIRDELTIGFGSLQAIRGKADPFPIAGADAVDALLLTGSGNYGVSVVKQLHELPDGRRFIIESVGWREAEPYMTRMLAVKTASNDQMQAAADRIWPKRISTQPRQKPMQLTSEKYKSDGFLVDLDLSGSVSSYTFLSGTTYYIPQSFSVNPGPATFQPGCVIKYGNDAYLVIYHQISCPAAGQAMPVLTSKDDNSFGTAIGTGNPTPMASKAIWIYVANASTVQNMRIRWAKRGLEYSPVYGPGPHYVRDSFFEHSQVGIYIDAPSCYFVSFFRVHNG